MKKSGAACSAVLLLWLSGFQHAQEAHAATANKAATAQAPASTQAKGFKTGEPLTIIDPAAPATPILKGTYVHGGVDAKLTHVRASRIKLDGKRLGYAVLLTPEKVDGSLAEWESADPAKRGSFIYLRLEPDGKVYMANLGHKAVAQHGMYGIMMELKIAGLEVRPGLIAGHIQTIGEQTFFDKPYAVDLQFVAPLEP